MKRLLPGKTEVAILLALAVVAAGIVALTSVPDLALAAMSIPLFITAALMGLRRQNN